LGKKKRPNFQFAEKEDKTSTPNVVVMGPLDGGGQLQGKEKETS